MNCNAKMSAKRVTAIGKGELKVIGYYLILHVDLGHSKFESAAIHLRLKIENEWFGSALKFAAVHNDIVFESLVLSYLNRSLECLCKDGRAGKHEASVLTSRDKTSNYSLDRLVLDEVFGVRNSKIARTWWWLEAGRAYWRRVHRFSAIHLFDAICAPCLVHSPFSQFAFAKFVFGEPRFFLLRN
ncbi:hypothetical protein PMAYCL1PPCAC_28716, partial [Pristionchus mayeri]